MSEVATLNWMDGCIANGLDNSGRPRITYTRTCTADRCPFTECEAFVIVCSYNTHIVDWGWNYYYYYRLRTYIVDENTINWIVHKFSRLSTTRNWPTQWTLTQPIRTNRNFTICSKVSTHKWWTVWTKRRWFNCAQRWSWRIAAPNWWPIWSITSEIIALHSVNSKRACWIYSAPMAKTMTCVVSVQFIKETWHIIMGFDKKMLIECVEHKVHMMQS